MNWLSQYVAPHHVGILLWAGVGVLTAALLIISRTSWGQARPLSKCIGLSVYAHILFGGYAYMTNLFEPPPVAEQPVMKIAYIEHEAQLEETPHQREDNDQPWEQLTMESAMAAPLEETERVPTPSLNSPATESVSTEDDLPTGDTRSSLEIPPPKVQAPAPEMQLPSSEKLKVARSQVAPTPIEAEPVTRTPSQTRRDPLRPGTIDMARIETSLPAARTQRPDRSEAETPLPQETDSIQRMAQIPLRAAAADAVFDRFDRLHRTENKAPQQQASNPPPAIASRGTPADSGRSQPQLATAAKPLPRRMGDGAVMPAPYRNRVEPLKSQALQRHGGNERTEAAVNAALDWLAKNQADDGRWSAAIHGAGRESNTLGHDRGGAGSRADTAMTGLAILAFVGAGHSHLEGEHRATVRKALEFMLGQQKPDGDLAGNSLLYARMYCHGIAFLSLSETYAMSGDHRLKPYVEQAMQFTLDSQHPSTGGWRYQPGDRGDLSQFGWQVMALRSAEHAGLTIPAETRTRLESFFRSVSAGQHGGLARYRQGERISRTMTAEALACRHFLGLDANGPAIEEATNYILQQPPASGKPNLYYWYYATLGLFPQQNEAWESWNGALIEQLIERQRTDGEATGSWDTDTQWGSYGGRVYTTALSALCLEVYYRYQPLLKAEHELREIRAAGRPLPWRR